MLISPASALPAGEEWAFEVKWDGMRALVSVGPAVRVHSRHGHDHTAAFPELAALVSLASRSRVVLDGELVCIDAATGRPSFERLMARTQGRLPTLSARQRPSHFHGFRRAGRRRGRHVRPPVGRTSATPTLLYELLPDEGTWRVSTAFADGPGLLAATAGMGLEGVVAKRVTSRYWPGRRTPYWRKVKHRSYEWFDLLGWRAPKGRDPGGRLAGRDGRVIACAFPALPWAERQRLDALVAEHGIEVPGGVSYRRAGPRSRSATWNGCRRPTPRSGGPCGAGDPVAELLLSAAESLHGEVQYQPPPLTMIPPPGRPAV